MLHRKTIHKKKNLFQKALQSLKSFLFGEYQRLPNTPSPNAFSYSSSNPKIQQFENFYRDFSEHWDSDHDEVTKRKRERTMSAKESIREEDVSSESFKNHAEQNVVKRTQEKSKKEEKKTESHHEAKKGDACSQILNGGHHALAQKIKELEMMDVNDVDHVLDIEEVLHCYSLLTSPVYLDIVDKFFMDMHSEFFLPQPSQRVNSSMRRLGPVKL